MSIGSVARVGGSVDRSNVSATDALGLKAYPGMSLSTEVSDVRVIALTPTLASVSTVFATEVNMSGGQVFGYVGVITMLLESSDGEWRVLTGHTSTPGGPPSDE